MVTNNKYGSNTRAVRSLRNWPQQEKTTKNNPSRFLVRFHFFSSRIAVT